ncbi:MAG: hypothetical protein AAF492_26800, partial [Verrucomicrobiota bacterium]
ATLLFKYFQPDDPPPIVAPPASPSLDPGFVSLRSPDARAVEHGVAFRNPTPRSVSVTEHGFEGPDASAFSLEGDTTFPLTVAASNKVGLTVRFTPTSNRLFEARLVLRGSQGEAWSASIQGDATVEVGRPKVLPPEYRILDPAAPPDTAIPTITLLKPNRAWIPWLVAVLLFSGLCAAYGRRLLRQRRKDVPTPVEIDPKLERHFPFERIGGEEEDWFDIKELNEAVAALGRYLGEDSGRRIDSEDSVRATIGAGGVPSLRFQPATRLRGVMVLEDEMDSAGYRNPAAAQLAGLLQREGVPVWYGRFRGTLGEYRDEEGRWHELGEFSEAENTALLIFSAGRDLPDSPQPAGCWTELNRWFCPVWLHPLEPVQRAAGPFPVANWDIPVYSATEAGVRNALTRSMRHTTVDREPEGDP